MENAIVQKPAHTDHYQAGRLGRHPSAIVIHRMLGSLAGTDNWFQISVDQRKKETPGGHAIASSAHYGVGFKGEIHQYVQETDTAWATGLSQSDVAKSTWPLIKQFPQPNYWTISIEHEGKEDDPFTDAMYESSAWLIARAAKKWNIPLNATTVVGHGEIYWEKRETCPGPQCDLTRLLIEARAQLQALNEALEAAKLNPAPLVAAAAAPAPQPQTISGAAGVPTAAKVGVHGEP